MQKIFEAPLLWMMLLHVSVSFLGVAIRNWRPSFTEHFRLAGVGGLLAVLSLHLDLEHFHSAENGFSPLLALAGAFLLMVFAHRFSSHKEHHDACCTSDAHPFVSNWWIVALLIHSLTDGHLLGASENLPSDLRNPIWAFLIVHKVLEALWVSSLVALEYKKKNLYGVIFAYILSFPLGYFLPRIISYFGSEGAGRLSWTMEMAGAISMGSLLACVLVDQIVPSLKNIRKNYKHLIWLVLGFFLTHGTLRLIGHDAHTHSHEDQGHHHEEHEHHHDEHAH